MTESQERKLDEMYTLVLEMQGDMKVYAEKHSNLLDGTIENSKEITQLRVDMNEYKADRNKMIGVALFGGILGTVATVCITIYEFFVKHT